MSEKRIGVEYPERIWSCFRLHKCIIEFLALALRCFKNMYQKVKLKSLREKCKWLQLFSSAHFKKWLKFWCLHNIHIYNIYNNNNNNSIIINNNNFSFVVSWRQNANSVVLISWKSEHNQWLNIWHVPLYKQTVQFWNSVWRTVTISVHQNKDPAHSESNVKNFCQINKEYQCCT
jgi:hypothetical protein